MPEDGWLIYKAGRGWYRPNAQGYTSSPAEAGRYSRAKALSYSHPNGLDGPRDGMSIKHESEVPGATRPSPSSDMVEAMARAMCAADPVIRMGDTEGVVQQRVRTQWKHYLPAAQAAATVIAEAMAAKDAELAELRAEIEALRGAVDLLPDEIDVFRTIRAAGRTNIAKARAVVALFPRAALGSAKG